MARRLTWSKPLVAIVGVLFLVLFVVSIFKLGGIDTDAYLIPGILGVFWAALFFVLVSAFAVIPQKPTGDEKFFARVKMRIRRGLYHLLGAVFLVLTFTVVALSLRLFGVWFAEI